jgi:hypothetical protein
MEEASRLMGADDPDIAAQAMTKYGNLTDRFTSLGGYAAEAEAELGNQLFSATSIFLQEKSAKLTGQE